MPGVIETREDPYYTIRTKLDGKAFELKFAYNEREERWRMSIADDVGTPIATGIKLIANKRLLYRLRYNTAAPLGELAVIDSTGDNSPPTLLELGVGKRCELIYWTLAETLEPGFPR